MSLFYLYDDARARTFEPFALSRPLGEVRAGALLIRQRWERALGLSCAGFLGAPQLRDFEEFDAPPAVTAMELPAGAIVVNARALPALERVDSTGLLERVGAADLLVTDGQVAAVRLAQSVPAERFSDGTLALEDLASGGWQRTTLRAHWLDAPWDLIRFLPEMLAADILALGAGRTCVAPPPATVMGDHPVFVEVGAHVEPLVVIDASGGPVLVSRGASIAAFSRLVGPCFIAPESRVLGGKVTNAAIGEQCRVGGEVNHAIFIGHANKAHDGFVGHSVLGRWVNLGAGTVTSNLKNTYGIVQAWTPGGMQSTGMQFFGTLFGDHAKTAIGTRLSTGSVIGAGASVIGNGMTPRVVVPFAWGDGDTACDPERFVTMVERMMARRGVALGDRGRRHLMHLVAQRWTSP